MASTPTTPRKMGRPSKQEKKAVEKIVADAKKDGLMPHEILLKAARGEAFKVKTLVIVKYKSGPNKGQEKERRWVESEYYPTYNEQIEAARSAAPYFAPRLATSTVKTDENTADALTQVMKELAGKLPG
jgi:hypothetical protein